MTYSKKHSITTALWVVFFLISPVIGLFLIYIFQTESVILQTLFFCVGIVPMLGFLTLSFVFLEKINDDECVIDLDTCFQKAKRDLKNDK